MCGKRSPYRGTYAANPLPYFFLGFSREKHPLCLHRRCTSKQVYLVSGGGLTDEYKLCPQRFIGRRFSKTLKTATCAKGKLHRPQACSGSVPSIGTIPLLHSCMSSPLEKAGPVKLSPKQAFLLPTHFLKTYFVLNYECACVLPPHSTHTYALHVCVGTWGGQKRAPNSLELESTVVSRAP